MAKRKKGQYILGQGKDFTVKLPSNGIGYCIELEPDWWYVVHAPTGKIVGYYANEELAVNLAIGSDLKDRKELDKQMENVILGKLDD